MLEETLCHFELSGLYQITQLIKCLNWAFWKRGKWLKLNCRLILLNDDRFLKKIQLDLVWRNWLSRLEDRRLSAQAHQRFTFAFYYDLWWHWNNFLWYLIFLTLKLTLRLLRLVQRGLATPWDLSEPQTSSESQVLSSSSNLFCLS
jgi:hypothetical protein